MRHVCLLALLVVPSLCFAGSYEFSFWPGENAEQDQRVVKIEAHPCGTVAMAKVSRMPAYSADAVLKPEPVVEVSAQGKPIHKWAIPVDAELIAISGQKLLVSYKGRYFWFRTDGSFKSAKPPSAHTAEVPTECVRPEEFQDSSSQVCHLFKDLATSQPRVLANEGICS